VSDLVLDASLALQWFLEDESGRQYGLSVLASLSSKRAVVPILWFYEWATAFSWPTGGSGLHLIKSTVF
jgi:hypothetical protein